MGNFNYNLEAELEEFISPEKSNEFHSLCCWASEGRKNIVFKLPNAPFVLSFFRSRGRQGQKHSGHPISHHIQTVSTAFVRTSGQSAPGTHDAHVFWSVALFLIGSLRPLRTRICSAIISASLHFILSFVSEFKGFSMIFDRLYLNEFRLLTFVW